MQATEGEGREIQKSASFQRLFTTLSTFAAHFNLILFALHGVAQFYLINGQKVNQHVIHLLFLIAPVPFGHIRRSQAILKF